MRIAILYYSATGTTALVCRAVQERLKGCDIQLVDMKKQPPGDLSEFDVLGFAFFADLLQPSRYFLEYLPKLRGVAGKPAFLINTFGSTGGKAPVIAFEALAKEGLTVIASHSLHTPESFPPLILSGFSFDNHPTKREMRRFERFAEDLQGKLNVIQSGGSVPAKRPRLGIIAAAAPRNLAGIFPKRFGPKEFSVEPEVCVRCGVCAAQCPGGAIRLESNAGPTIDRALCQQCWGCYNHCAAKAIRVAGLRGEGRYAAPTAQFRMKILPSKDQSLT